MNLDEHAALPSTDMVVSLMPNVAPVEVPSSEYRTGSAGFFNINQLEVNISQFVAVHPCSDRPTTQQCISVTTD
jgi:hypothetical protein